MDCYECGGYGFRWKSTLPEGWRFGYRAGVPLESLYPGSYGFVAELRQSLYKETCQACAGTGLRLSLPPQTASADSRTVQAQLSFAP